MNKLIKKQLQSCSVASLPEFDDDTTELFIPQYKQVRVEEDHMYILKLDKSLVVPNGNDTFHINWNRGRIPPTDTLLVEVSKINGRMIFVNAVGWEGHPTDVVWDGWLPLDRLEIVECR